MLGFYSRNRIYCSAAVALLSAFGFAIVLGIESPWWNTGVFFVGAVHDHAWGDHGNRSIPWPN